jgi:hypothetical protein
MKKTTIIILLLISSFIASCGNDDFKEQSKLGDLRVLAISANTPEINSGSTLAISMTPLISYVDGAGVTLNYTWEACPDPGIDFGADINCDSSLSALKVTGTGTLDTSALLDTAGGVVTFFTGFAPAAITLNVPAAVFSSYLASLNSTIQFNGVNYLFKITYTDPNNGNKITALKKIKLSSKATGDLNTNPSFTNILFNGSALSSYPTTEGKLLLDSASAAQSYSQVTNVGTKTFNEDMFISWYSNTGEYLFNRTDVGEENTFTPEGTSGVFVAVYRDSRGGIFSIVRSYP